MSRSWLIVLAAACAVGPVASLWTVDKLTDSMGMGMLFALVRMSYLLVGLGVIGGIAAAPLAARASVWPRWCERSPLRQAILTGVWMVGLIVVMAALGYVAQETLVRRSGC